MMYEQVKTSPLTGHWKAVPHFKIGRNARLAWLSIAGIIMMVMIVAARLNPEPCGIGTHRQMGLLIGDSFLPPCSWPLITGLPCPTCGMTTAFANVVHGRPFAAFLAQPAGMIFCCLLIVIMCYGLYVAVTGWAIWINWDRISVRMMMGIAMLLVIGWGFKLAYGLWTGALPYG